MITIGQVGLGYWGLNVLRNFIELSEAHVELCCDTDPTALETARARYPHIGVTRDYEQILDDAEIDAVVITSPTPTHYQLALEALQCEKHVFVEKPITLCVAEAEELIELADKQGLILMVGHLMKYHPAVRQLKGYVEEGELGQIYYVTSSRLNLGRVRRSENAMWSLAPHDISMTLYLLDEMPERVSAQGMDHLQPGIQDTVFLTMRFASKKMGYVHVSWLDPHKVRRVTVVGSRKMATFDDVESTNKLAIYDKGANNLDYQTYGEALSLRFGDIYIPRVNMQEPLRLECQHFLECISSGRQPFSDGHDGLRVLKVLEAGQRSLERQGSPIPLED